MAKKATKKDTFNISFSYQNLLWVLVAFNILTIFLWKPWDSAGSADRTITITGEATIEAEPDLFTFSPQYELTGDDQDGVLEKATVKANEVVDGLKELGVEDKNIKLSSSSYNNWWYDEEEDTNYAYVNLTVETENRDFAQEIQDYLISTGPEGQISPWSTFTEETQDTLELQAREQAIADAKEKATQSATELGTTVGRVVSVTEGNGFGGFPVAYAADALAIAESADGNEVARSLPIQPGENEFNFSITVVFEIK